MKERPILFSAPMVRALLKGRKSQTRRQAKILPPAVSQSVRAQGGSLTNPFGQAGDRLWVKETWGTPAEWDHLKPSQLSRDQLKAVCYHADGGIAGKTRSSLFMPRAASRILLEIVEVRFERLQAISKEDALAEGVDEPDAVRGYANLWDRINGNGSWAQNPGVWVVSFRRVK